MELSKGDRKEASGDNRLQSTCRSWKASQDRIELRRPHSTVSTNQPKSGVYCKTHGFFMIMIIKVFIHKLYFIHNFRT